MFVDVGGGAPTMLFDPLYLPLDKTFCIRFAKIVINHQSCLLTVS